jgi:hypothetical protein
MRDEGCECVSKKNTGEILSGGGGTFSLKKKPSFSFRYFVVALVKRLSVRETKNAMDFFYGVVRLLSIFSLSRFFWVFGRFSIRGP